MIPTSITGEILFEPVQRTQPIDGDVMLRVSAVLGADLEIWALDEGGGWDELLGTSTIPADTDTSDVLLSRQVAAGEYLLIDDLTNAAMSNPILVWIDDIPPWETRHPIDVEFFGTHDQFSGFCKPGG